MKRISLPFLAIALLSDLSSGLAVAPAFAASILSDRQSLAYPGCNSPTWTQIPGRPDDFVGRVRKDAPNGDLNSCNGGEVYTLAWGRMDWTNNRISYYGKMIDLNTVNARIQDGKYKLTSAYDPSIMHDGREYWLAFECGGTGFPGTAATCMAPVRFDAPGGLDLGRSYVAVQGVPTDRHQPFLVSASVPKLLFDEGRVYLYWTSVKIPKGVQNPNDWHSLTTRGIELVKDERGRWIAKGYGVELPADHPLSSEVFAPEDRPGLRRAADAFQISKIGSSYYLVGSVGDCVIPTASTLR